MSKLWFWVLPRATTGLVFDLTRAYETGLWLTRTHADCGVCTCPLSDDLGRQEAKTANRLCACPGYGFSHPLGASGKRVGECCRLHCDFCKTRTATRILRHQENTRTLRNTKTVLLENPTRALKHCYTSTEENTERCFASSSKLHSVQQDSVFGTALKTILASPDPQKNSNKKRTNPMPVGVFSTPRAQGSAFFRVYGDSLEFFWGLGLPGLLLLAQSHSL